MISTNYINNKTLLEFICEKGHKFKKLSADVRNYGCLECYRELPRTQEYKEKMSISVKQSKKDILEKTFNKYKTKIEEIGGNCITTLETYKGTTAKIERICEKGHKQQTHPHVLFDAKDHCKICLNKEKLTIEQAREIAKQRGGKCLSTEYKNSAEKLLWECADGHQWETPLSSIKNKYSWCPYDNTQLKEEICRTIFQYLFEVNFNKIRPNWLLSPKKKPMELDGYNEPLKLAYEFNGIQHYESVRGSDVEYQKKKDILKLELCIKEKITLIVIPYTVKIKNLPEYITNECKKYNIQIKNTNTIDLHKLKINYKNELDKLKALALLKKGELLSTTYLGNTIKLSWKCHNKHIFEKTPEQIKLNKWCPTCPKI